MLVIRAGTHKMLDRITNREDSDQTASSEAVWSGSALFVYVFLASNQCLKLWNIYRININTQQNCPIHVFTSLDFFPFPHNHNITLYKLMTKNQHEKRTFITKTSIQLLLLSFHDRKPVNVYTLQCRSRWDTTKHGILALSLHCLLFFNFSSTYFLR